MTYISNGRIITQNRVETGAVLIDNGKIKAICSAGTAPPKGVEIFDAAGAYVSPGFIDIHNHGRLGASIEDLSEQSLETIACGQLAAGVTGFLAGPSTMQWERYLQAIRLIARWCEKHETGSSAQCLGIYLEGMFFSEQRRGAHLAEFLRHPAQADIDAVLEAGASHIRIFSLAPELPGALEAITKISLRGITVSLAHSNADFYQAMAALDAGAAHSTHTYNAMPPLNHHEPGILGAVLADDRVTCELIADGIHIAPAVLDLTYRMKGPDRIALVSDSVLFNGMQEGEYPYRGTTVTISQGSVRLADGRLAGSCLNLNRAVFNMTKMTHASIPEAVRMASLNPARAAGIERRKGSITAGKDADLVLLDDDFNVREVFIMGRRVKLP